MQENAPSDLVCLLILLVTSPGFLFISHCLGCHTKILFEVISIIPLLLLAVFSRISLCFLSWFFWIALYSVMLTMMLLLPDEHRLFALTLIGCMKSQAVCHRSLFICLGALLNCVEYEMALGLSCERPGALTPNNKVEDC